MRKINKNFLKQCVLQLPLGKKFDRFRADSTSYQADIFNYCEDENILFTVTAKKNRSMFNSIKSIKDEEWQTFSKREKIAEFTHTMQDTKNAFRMIVIKKDITPTLPTLEGYIGDEVMMQHQDEIYYCIAGKVISHARDTILKVNEEFINLLQTIRQRAYEMSLE